MTPRECDYCRSKFTPQRMGQRVCSPVCAGRLVKAKKAQGKREMRERKEAIKTLPTLHREAQAAFNAWVRARDADQPCISCGKPPKDASELHAGRDAGHYRSVGSASHLRYHEDNVHAQCVHCNQWGAGRAVEYRMGLIARIGLARVEALECDNTPRKWTREEVTVIRDTYKAKKKELERNDG